MQDKHMNTTDEHLRIVPDGILTEGDVFNVQCKQVQDSPAYTWEDVLDDYMHETWNESPVDQCSHFD